MMRFAIISFAILFGVLSFAPNMQGGQFFKLSEVIEHYENHQESEDSFSSILSFVKEHYFSNNTTDENERHLPFKSTVVGAFVLVIHQVELQPIHEYLFSLDREKSYFGEPNGHIQNRIISVWNPPQVA